MLPVESAGAAGCAIWTRARYFARLIFSASRLEAWSQLAVATIRQQSTVFTGALLELELRPGLCSHLIKRPKE
jgi:hypothetical protein